MSDHRTIAGHVLDVVERDRDTIAADAAVSPLPFVEETLVTTAVIARQVGLAHEELILRLAALGWKPLGRLRTGDVECAVFRSTMVPVIRRLAVEIWSQFES